MYCRTVSSNFDAGEWLLYRGGECPSPAPFNIKSDEASCILVSFAEMTEATDIEFCSVCYPVTAVRKTCCESNLALRRFAIFAFPTDCERCGAG